MVKACAWVLLLPSLLLGVVPTIDRPVTDTKGLLSSADTEKVSQELVRLREQTGAQMAVLIVGTTDGEPIEDYTIRAAQAWRGGQAGQSNGLLYVLAVDDRRMRLDVGYGLEEHLPDDAVRRLLDAQLPLMRQKDYAGAIVQIIQGVRERLPANQSGVDPATASASGTSSLEPDMAAREVIFVTFVLIAMLAIFQRLSDLSERTLGVLRAGFIGAALLNALLVSMWSEASTGTLLLLVVEFSACFLGGQLVLLKSSARMGASLMMGSLAGHLFVMMTQRGEAGFMVFASVIFSFLACGAVLFLSLLDVSVILFGPTIFLFGGSSVWNRDSWFYSSRSPASSSWDSSTHTSSSSSSSGSSSASSSSWDSSSSSSSWDSSSSSSSSWDSSSSSSSWDSSSSSSSSSDWSGGGGDFGGGGASSSW